MMRLTRSVAVVSATVARNTRQTLLPASSLAASSASSSAHTLAATAVAAQSSLPSHRFLSSASASSPSASSCSAIPLHSSPRRSFSTSPEESTAPSASESGARQPPGLTRLVLDALASGPKTRRQLFWAINHGPPDVVNQQRLMKEAEALAEKKAFRESQRAVNIASAAAGRGRGQTPRITVPPIPAYPTGPLRNPTHLHRILANLLRGDRVWSIQAYRIADRIGDSEIDAVKQIQAKAQQVKETAPDVKLVECEDLPSGTDEKSAAASTTGTGYVFVSRDWFDPEFAAKAEDGRAKFEAKYERQRVRREAAKMEAQKTGKIYVKPTRKQQIKKEKEERAEAEKKALRIRIAEYKRKLREEMGAEASTTQ